jgi:phosphoglycerol transferase MdoB-like AlkP superfamily enzyme
MKVFQKYLLLQTKLIAKAILVSFFLYFLCRVFFHIHNYNSFKGLIVVEFFRVYFFGFYFDASAIALTNVIFLLIFILPLPLKFQRFQFKIAGCFFIVFNSIAILYNFFDIAYFPFTNKRLTIDMLDFGGDNGNLIKLIPRFLLSFWYLVLVLVLLIYFLYKWTKNNIFNFSQAVQPLKNIPRSIAFLTSLILWFSLLLLFFRGWFVRIPIGIVDANKYVAVQNTPLLINTIFSVSKSIGTDIINEYHYFNDDTLNEIYNPISKPTGNPFVKKNVVVIMVESLSKEFVGSLSGLPTHTPFLDSLSKHSLVFSDAYANGKQSVQGIPAITSSLPSIMDGYFINTPYTNNHYKGLGTLLTEQGYYTAFFHGAHNGSMNFDAYANQAGYKDYFGKNEYPNQNDFDGNWGIWDEEFLSFTADKMKASTKPFHFAIFTLSSHNPYLIPKKYEKRFIDKSENPLVKFIEYTDFSLQQFFNKIKNADWYKNTLFVITADHTGESQHPFYANLVGQYQIPIIIFDPSKNVQEINNQTTSQVDILPTILHLLNYTKPSFSFGNDVFNKPSFGIFYGNKQYKITQNGFLLSFDGTKSTSLYQFSKDSLLQHNLIKSTILDSIKIHLETHLKAYIQQYNNRLIKNKLLVE